MGARGAGPSGTLPDAGVDPGVVAATYTAMIDAFVALELREREAGAVDRPPLP